MQTSLNFWRDLLGLQLHAEWDAGAYLTCGDLWVRLSYDVSRNYVAALEIDYTHYAFSVAPEDFEWFSYKLKQAGMMVWEDNKSEGQSSFFLDLDGHKLELHVGNLVSRQAQYREKPYCGMRFESEK